MSSAADHTSVERHPVLPTVVSSAAACSRGVHLLEGRRADGGRKLGELSEAAEATRAVATTAIRKRAKPAFPFSLEMRDVPVMVLKPNWLVRARGADTSAEFLLDGLDGTHYVIAFRKRA